MAEVTQGFEAAMRRGREFGAAGTWDKALQEYVRAVQLNPSDISARYGLAEALASTDQIDYALQQLQGIVRNQPQHTNGWHLMAQLQHQTGRIPEAIQTFQRLKEIYNKAGQKQKIVETLREILQADPAQVGAYRELMDLAKARGDRKAAALVAVELGQYYLTQNQKRDALSSANEALMLLPGLPEAYTLKSEAGGSLPSRAISAAEKASPAFDMNNLPPLPNFDEGGQKVNPAQSNGQGQSPSAKESTINQLIKSAEDSLARGETGLALRNYEMAVEAGTERADVFYSIGNLYSDQKQLEPAVKYLRLSTSDPDYAASAYFGMGQLFAEANRLDEAAHAYTDALNLIDLQTIGREEVDELIDMYDALGDVLLRQTKDQEALELYNRLVKFINDKNLRTEKSALVLINARELNKKLNPTSTLASAPVPLVPAPPSLNGNGSSGGAYTDDGDEQLTSSIRFGATDDAEEGPQSLDNSRTLTGVSQPIGIFGATGSNGSSRSSLGAVASPALPPRFPTKLVEMDPHPNVQPYLRAAQDFMRNDKLNAAIDACQEMIHYFPEYIPAQAILSEIYVTLDRPEQARQKYQFVVDLYQLRQEPQKSLECYKRLGELSPDNMGLRTKLANMLLQYDQKEEAAEVLLSTISNYVRTGQLERALEECKKLRSLAPQSASIRVQYAELLARMDRYNEALPELRRALEIDPENLKALALLNISSFLLNDANLRWSSFQTVIERARQNETNLRQLMEEYRQANLLNSNSGLYYAQACLYLENKQPKPAERLFNQALETSAMDTGSNRQVFELLVHWQLGQLFVSQQRADDAVREIAATVEMVDKADPALFAGATAPYGSLPSQIGLFRKLSQAYQAQGQPTQAIKSLKQIKKLMPYSREVHTELAELYFNQGQLTEALSELGELVAHFEETGKLDQMIEVLKEMAALAPNNIGVRDKLSDVYLKRGFIDDGLRELDELAELQRKNGRLKDAVRTLQRAAETYGMMGKLDSVYELYNRIVRISPGDVEARQQLVNRHLMSGRVAEAIEEQRTIAQICLQANNTQGAIAAYHQVIGLAPEDPRAYFQLASVLTTTNEHYQSYRLYQRILRLEPNNEKAKDLMGQAQKLAIEAHQMPENTGKTG